MWIDIGAPELAELKHWVDRKYAQLITQRKWKGKRQSMASLLNDLLLLDEMPLATLETAVLRETDHTDYAIRTLVFQSQNGVFLPANLYIPKGVGPFPAILNSHGHWDGGKAGDIVQQMAQRMVRAGYVVLCIDAWGGGERGSQQKEEYHGGNLGAALFDVGTSLLAVQLLDNKQAINLLCSLPFVDTSRIGAVGASGGGNQTLWITAYDERIKAAVPVVSVGTFEGYLLQRNCVCELLPNGLAVLEAKDLLSRIAPRCVHILSATREDIPAFQPSQMLRAYEEAHAEQVNKFGNSYLSYKLFDEGHDFSVAMQAEALDFFNEKFAWPSEGAADTYSRNERATLNARIPLEVHFTLAGTMDYVQDRHEQMRAYLMSKVELVEDVLLTALHKSLNVDDNLAIDHVEHTVSGRAGWSKIILTTSDEQNLHLLTKEGTPSLPTQLILPAMGMASISEEEMVSFTTYEGTVVLMDVFGVRAQQTVPMAALDEDLPAFHSLARTLMWLGETLVGRWVSEIRLVVDFLREKQSAVIQLIANRETTLAALCYQALYRGAAQMKLTELPLSLMPQRTDLATKPLNMAVHIPGIISWGDVSMLRALIDIPVLIQQPIDSAGQAVHGKQIDDLADWTSSLKNKIRK
ncbi:alpha/beta hydrolase family protein [Sphingobacterium deserti]|uniref:Acetyl xylan esterase n=1 Tax=Sphingobacterium deserti TaxID=1229276 RepID=A0A0B8SZP2_9SPHI|nr:acetylxylan esterase [Sphingobacterium deserti]KGE13076.1 acetyl xylan esterase [Sphingobacterium deserti]